MDSKLIYGIVGVFAMLIGVGGTVLLTQDQFDKTYVCPLNEQVAVFSRLSPSLKTGYYTLSDGTEQAVSCRLGQTYVSWVKLVDYAKSKGFDPNSFIVQNKANTGVTEGTKWLCSPNGCERLL